MTGYEWSGRCRQVQAGAGVRYPPFLLFAGLQPGSQSILFQAVGDLYGWRGVAWRGVASLRQRTSPCNWK
jgi:hypothetical protein